MIARLTHNHMIIRGLHTLLNSSNTAKISVIDILYSSIGFCVAGRGVAGNLQRRGLQMTMNVNMWFQQPRRGWFGGVTPIKCLNFI